MSSPRMRMFLAPFCALAVCEASSSSDAHETDILQLCNVMMGKGVWRALSDVNGCPS